MLTPDGLLGKAGVVLPEILPLVGLPRNVGVAEPEILAAVGFPSGVGAVFPEMLAVVGLPRNAIVVFPEIDRPEGLPRKPKILSTVTATAAETVVFPAASRATAVKVWLPSVAVVVFHVIPYVDVVSSAPRLAPSSLNWTPTTPTSSLAEAVTETVEPDTVAPPLGAVMLTVGAVVSPPSVRHVDGIVPRRPSIVAVISTAVSPSATIKSIAR
jgi:hypothetical protein